MMYTQIITEAWALGVVKTKNFTKQKKIPHENVQQKTENYCTKNNNESILEILLQIPEPKMANDSLPQIPKELQRTPLSTIKIYKILCLKRSNLYHCMFQCPSQHRS